jgi:16S rRNA (cytidine1402-2'-O)-methyltransferase
MAGTLFLVATPIGNLDDITLRAIETLKRVPLIIAEDTRRGRILCERFGIGAKLVSMPAFQESQKADSLLAPLVQGGEMALITDAGSPAISDPGARLVERAIVHGISVVPIPGPSAVIAALGASGLSTEHFYFAGFLPRGGPARARLLALLKRLEATIVLYESPERLQPTLRELAKVFGDRRAVVARELTKIHEELVRGSLSQLAERFSGRVLGEITVVVAGASEEASQAASDDAIRAELHRRLAAGETSIKEMAKEIAQATGRPRHEVYALAIALKE